MILLFSIILIGTIVAFEYSVFILPEETARDVAQIQLLDLKLSLIEKILDTDNETENATELFKIDQCIKSLKNYSILYFLLKNKIANKTYIYTNHELNPLDKKIRIIREMIIEKNLFIRCLKKILNKSVNNKIETNLDFIISKILWLDFNYSSHD